MNVKNDDLNSIKALNILAIILFLIGLMQIGGYVFNLSMVRGFGAALTVAPFPKVFSDVDGVETFTSTFVLEYTDDAGKAHKVEITPGGSIPNYPGRITGAMFMVLLYRTGLHQNFRNVFSTGCSPMA